MPKYSVHPIDAAVEEPMDINSVAGGVASQVTGLPLFTFSIQDGFKTFGSVFPDDSFGTAINSAATPIIVGAAATHAFRWESGAAMFTDLHPSVPAGFSQSLASDINDAGDIVGTSYSPNEPQASGWFLPHDAPVLDLTKAIDPTVNAAVLVNNAAQIMGYMALPNDTNQVFFYDTGAKQSMLLPAQFQLINDLNDQAVAVGGGVDGPGALYDRKTNTTHSPPLLPDNSSSDIHGINNLNQIVGASQGQPFGGIVAQYNGTAIVDLHSLDDDVPGSGPAGWSIGVAYRINDQGEIIGMASWQGGKAIAVLLKPMFFPAPPPFRPVLFSALAYIQILWGVINDAPGLGLAGGQPVHPDPIDPGYLVGAGERDVMLGFAINGIARSIDDPLARAEIQRVASKLVQTAAERMNAVPGASQPPNPERAATPSAAPGMERLRGRRAGPFPPFMRPKNLLTKR